MTIARGRWQEHLKTRGDHYHETARALEALDADDPEVGAETAALAHHALAEVLEACRAERLTRHQHILLRLGALIAQARVPRRSPGGHRAATGELHPKAVRRLRAPRDRRRQPAQRPRCRADVATDAIRWVAGAEGGDLQAFDERLHLASIYRSQAGLLADLDESPTGSTRHARA